ncbi:hypothetical protein VULLAG_LOCUS2580 [Vulpes lagopus]
MRRGLVYLKGQRCPCPALPTGPAAGRPGVRSEACSDGARWREKDAGRKERLGRGPRGSPPRPTPSRGSAHAPGAPAPPPRAALSPWQPRRDGGGARAGRGLGADRAGRGGAGAAGG